MSKQRNSKLVRVPNNILAKLQSIRKSEGSWGRAIEKLLADSPTALFWSIPSQLFTTEDQAKAAALKLAATKGAAFEDREVPIKLGAVRND